MGSLDSPVTGVYSFSYSHEQVFLDIHVVIILKELYFKEPLPPSYCEQQIFF